jgi:dienelactone hydrolase
VLGRTPLRTRLPRGTLRFRFEHAGYDPVFLARNLTGAFEPPAVVLPPAGSEVDEVQVPGATLPVSLSGFETEALVTLPTFYIDRTEVTNRAFKAFVDASGYEQAELWPAGAAPPSVYVDITGRRGPATWEAGDFPSGRGEEPVGGVSWYEASAYCAFRGRALPTVYHWSRAALAPREVTAPMGPSIVPLSNFGTPAPAPAGQYPGLGPYGTVDMAGNVREWTWNATGGDARRLILGGAWNDPDYMFSVPFSLPPADRSAANGFRCMRADSAIEPALLAPVDVSSTDYRNARPVPLEVFQEFAKQFAYVPSQAKAAIEGRETTPAGSLREHATIDVGYNGERMRVYVFLPQGVAPPYDAIIYFPALNAFQAKASSTTFYPADYVVKSGRAMVLPVFKGSFERWDRVLGLTGEEYMRAMHVRLTEWRQDLGRTIDYLASRGDINAQQVGYYGRSFGASMPLALLALEPRIATAVLYSGGFTYRPLPAATDPVNYVSRVTMPVLMLNGRHDYVLPYETSQKPLFRMFGTPPADKKHVVYDAGHDALPRNQFIKEILAWLDRYLGAAK